MIGALTYEEVLRATMRSNWIHALWLFAVVVLIWVCTILLTLYGNRKKKPKDKDDSWQVSVFLLVLVVIGYGICVGTSVPEENARIQRDIDEHAYVTVHGSYTRNAASRRRCLQKKRHALACLFFVITQHYRFFEIAFKKSVYDSKNNLMRRAHLSFDSSVVSETAPSSRSVTT